MQARSVLQRRCFADSAVATQLKEPDWEAFQQIVTSDEGKRQLATLRSQFAEVKTRLTSISTVGHPLSHCMLCVCFDRAPSEWSNLRPLSQHMSCRV